MPDIFKMFEETPSNKQTPNPASDQKTQHEDFLEYPNDRKEAQSQGSQSQQEPGRAQNNFESDTITNDPREQERAQNTMYSNSELGEISTKNTQNLEADPESWTPEYTMKPFLDEAGTSIVRGIGNHILKGTGDMLQVAGSYAGFDISKGNMISRALQESGNALADKNKSYIPEELLAENLDFSSMINPKFWSTQVAEMIPQIAEFVLLSKGGAGIAKAGAKKLLKNKAIKTVAKNAGLGKAAASTVGAGKKATKVFGTGKGVMGKLATDQGLTSGMSAATGAVGGGITSNFMSGLLNAAQVVNDHKELKDTNGNLIFSKEDLSQMASGTMRNNAGWLLYDMASFGMTYGGGWKALKGMNPVAKGGKLFNAAQRSKISSKMFRYDIAPIVKNVAKLSGKAGFEGFEETFQETYEEWSAQKAISDVTGEPMKHKSFMDFYNSEENKATKVISFATGILGGAAFNLSTLVNKKADDNLKLYNRIENFKKIVDKNGTEEELNWQEYHIRQQIADIVIDDNIGLYEDFTNKLVENGNITEDEKVVYDEMVENFQEVKAKGKRLNVKGLSALMYNNAKESYFDKKIDEYQTISEERIATYKELDDGNSADVKKKIKEEEQIFEKRLKALSILKAEASQNQRNLILGKKANPLEVDLVLDEFGNEMVIGGLSTQDYNKYTNDNVSKSQKAADAAKGVVGGIKSAGKAAQQEAENRGFKMPSMSNLSKQGKEMVNKVMDQFKSAKEPDNQETEENAAKSKEKASDSTDANNQEQENAQTESTKTETEAQQEAQQAAEKVEIDPNEVVSDEIYKAFQEDGELDLKTIQDIATAIRKKGKLSPRQDEMRDKNKETVMREITKQILNTSTQANEGDTISSQQPGTKKTESKNPKNKEDSEVDKEVDEEVEDEDLTDAEKAFVKTVAKGKQIGKTIGDVGKRKLARAKELYRLKKKNTENAEEAVGSDRKAGTTKEKTIPLKNRLQSIFMNDVVNKIRNRKNPDVENLSQNEMDNYLNTMSAYNEFGPTELDKMIVVNHQLKRMFPNAETPKEAFIVRNMFQTLGGDALGHAMAGTIFIDSKAWNQDRIFMHEMSHIYFQLAKNEPETKEMLRNAIKDKQLLDRVKKMYDHLTYYSIDIPGGKPKRFTKQNIFAEYKRYGVKPENLEAQLEFEIKEGTLNTVPLSQQGLILEELFVARLEGPLSDNFDKIFQPKNEPRRQKDVKKWWGLIRKKGEIIEEDDGVNFMLRKLSEDGIPSGNLKDYILDTFKAVTVGVDVSAEGMDALAMDLTQAEKAELESIRSRKVAVADFEIKNAGNIREQDIITDLEEDLEDDGTSFYDKDFESKAKGATRVIKRFGQVYNKAMRKRFLAKNKDKKADYKKVPLFDRDMFESTLYSLAVENKTANEFIRQIENSELREVRAFDSYMKSIHGDNKLNFYNSMHFVFSNAKHISGFNNTIDNNGKYSFNNSMSQLEVHKSNLVLKRLKDEFDKHISPNSNSPIYNKFQESVYNIYNGSQDKQDLFNVIEALVPAYGQFNLQKILDQGHVTYKGQTMPIETLVYGFIKKRMMFQKNVTRGDYKKAQEAYAKQLARIPGIENNSFFAYEGVNIPIKILKTSSAANFNQFKALPLPGDPAKGIYIYNARPLVESFISTNRKFSPLSSIMNAQKNMTPVRITNNHLTKEVDNMIEFLTPDADGDIPTEEQFFDRFSHLAEKNKKRAGKNYVPNLFLQNIYENMQKGILPTISQYHGIENVSDRKGNLYAGSSALEQGIEDFMTFVTSSRNPNGSKNNSYLGSVGTFSDSPRKFFMNMPRIKFEDVFSYDDDGKLKFHSKSKGHIMTSAQHLYDELFWDGPIAGSRTKFQNKLKDAVRNEIRFINKNGEELAKIDKLKPYFKKDNRLTPEGIEMVSEYVINNIVNGQNVTEVFLPGIKGSDIVKRMKMNSSPIFSAKNPNFKIEPLFFADEIVNGSIAGTDSGMYILKEDAAKLQKLGKGVFDMNNGFKLLNASIEKNNPKFKGKAAYLKGYTTIIKEGHPMYKSMKIRKDKYNAYHKEKFGVDPSLDLSDGSFNHMVIAIPQSSDKTNFSPEKFIEKGEHTEKGEKMTPNYLRDNPEHVNQTQDDLYYKDGEFVGIETYNFGPQQVMDKQVSKSNTPVQMINSIIVNAGINGQLKLANEIQQHISNQKQANLNRVLEGIEDHTAQGYRELVMREMNREEMNQAQRIMLEDNGSLGTPYVNEIVTNQLGQTIRRNGNKLFTPGTLAHQKPDIGIEIAGGKENQRLKGYQTNGDGSLAPAEMYLPKHMEGSINQREMVTMDSSAGKTAIENYTKGLSKAEKAEQTPTQDMNALKFAAIELAMKRHSEAIIKDSVENETTQTKAAEKYIGTETDKFGYPIGYHVKGDKVIASRVPGHGPASTGVFEVVGFDSSEGNQVMVSSEFNDIIGSDNDGDALFIQMKGKKNYDEWNQAFDKITQYWLSPNMKEQITAQMEFETQSDAIVEEINQQFPSTKEYIMPFSPEQRRIDYSNTMVSKRNVGPVFNTHKMTNMLAAYEIGFDRPITIRKTNYKAFKDYAKGNESRNQQSAILANIILDNAKHGYADAMGIDEHNINQAVLMVNIGVPLMDVAKILNSPAAKMWSDLNRNNNSMFHSGRKRSKIVEQIYKNLRINPEKNKPMVINPDKAHEKNQQQAIIETFNYLDNMNSEVQTLGKIMSGHNTIHVNPLVLEQQLEKFSEVVNAKKENQILAINEDFKNNAELKNYRLVAEKTLEHMKRVNPVYRTATNKVLKALKTKIGDIGTNEIENISRDFQKFQTSRLLAHNNVSKEYAKDLMNPNSDTSLFNKLNKFLRPIRNNIDIDKNNILNSVSAIRNSLLFTKAMNVVGKGNDVYISANSSFVNESFNEQERQRAQQEFEDLPTEIQDDLILYDLINHGWKGPQSLAPFFGKDTNMLINMASNEALRNNDERISPAVLEELEQTIALKQSLNASNSFSKIYLPEKSSANSKQDVFKEMFKQKKDGDFEYNTLINSLSLEGGKYINVWDKKGNSALYEVADMVEFLPEILSERTSNARKIRLHEMVKENTAMIPNNLTYDKSKRRYTPNIDLALITDKNVGDPNKTRENYDEREYSDELTEATISFEEASAKMREALINKQAEVQGMDAVEEFDIPMFEKEEVLTENEYNRAMEYNPLTHSSVKEKNYKEYLEEKKEANKLATTLIPQLENASQEELLDMYAKYGENNVYAYSIVMTPIIKKLAGHLASDQAQLWEDNEVEGLGFDGKDVSKMQAYMMSGSTIPSNHPASQALAKKLEAEYKNFTSEKSKYMSRMNQITDALYKEKLGYGSKRSVMSTLKRIRDMIFTGQSEIYQKLYGNLVTRQEITDKTGKVTYDFRLRPKEEIEKEFKAGVISKAEKDFYDNFKATTKELMPAKVDHKKKHDYIPHTSMSRLEAFSARGLLGLMVQSRNEDEALADVKLKYKAPGEESAKLMNFRQIEDTFKRDSISVHKRNDIKRIKEYRQLKKKAKELLKTGKNEDGSKIIYGTVGTETALGFGAINRFANNRSIKATELPSMDLNKALGDYIHSTLFVNGNKNFKGMEKLQGYIDGVIAFNRENNLENMNVHVQKVWKDYFTKGKRQTSVLGKTGDKVINGLTRFNLFYSLGYSANKNTGGLYAIGNILVGKYHNIKDNGGKAWINGELKYWGLDKGLEGGIEGILARKRRINGIMKSLNFMEINVYDEVNLEKKSGLDAIFSDLALAPIRYSEKWIQQVHMIGKLTDEELNRFDEAGKYKGEGNPISNERLAELEDQVKASHGRGYQPTDQRAMQMYSWGNMMLQFSKFLPTMVHDRFSKEDINIYGKEHIGSLRAVGKMVRYVYNRPEGFVEYRKNLSPEQRARLDSGLKGMAISAVAGMAGMALQSDTANDLFWDSNYYFNFNKLENKAIPPAIQTTTNLMSSVF